jgi:glucoamylase
VHGRRAATSLALALLLVLTLCSSAAASRGFRNRLLPLDAQTVAVGPGGALLPVRDPGLLVPGSRVLAGTSDARAELAAERAWLAAGSVPTVRELGDSTLVRDALLDLRTLSLPTGVPVAGWSPAWRYVWPRDSSLAAVALARTGHPADAEAVLDFLQRVQPDSGVFAARYLPDGSGVPDDRPAQLDGVGWALWALAAVVEARPAAEQPALIARYRGLLDRSASAAQRAVANPRSLPPASSDYWERRERRLTLATAALVRAGLVAAGRLYARAGDPRVTAVEDAAGRLAAAVTRGFAADGYPRHLGGTRSSVDLGVVFLLPPFAPDPRQDVVAAWRTAPQLLARPAGGLAPGGSWPDDGVSWTTATSSYALAAATLGDRAAAATWLRWLDDHRTAAGSLPEKVLADGSPAAVAPLAWSAAAVVLSAAALSG